jgi:short-subunit dehydrogenase
MMSAHRRRNFADRYGPWAVVTGASSGIGKAIALQLGENGLKLLVVARRNELLNDLAAQLAGFSGIETRVVVADLATPSGIATVEAACTDLDVGLLVAAAGFGTSGSFLDADLPTEMEMLAVNCGALLSESLFFGRRFAERGRGGIVLMASLVGFQGVPFSASYAATKAYVQNLAEALYVELGPLGIDVLASAPGPVRSGFEGRANMRMSAAIEPEVVARETLRALVRRSSVTPGLLSKVLTYSLAPLPRPLRTRIMAQVMGDMTKHQRKASV